MRGREHVPGPRSWARLTFLGMRSPRATSTTSCRAPAACSSVNEPLRGRGTSARPLAVGSSATRLWFYSAYPPNWGCTGTSRQHLLRQRPHASPGRESERVMWDANVRLTYQVSAAEQGELFLRLAGPIDSRSGSSGGAPSRRKPATATYYPTMYIAQSRWTSPITSQPALRGQAG